MADGRTYIRVHDGMDEHPKVEPLSDAAFRLLITNWFYCSRTKSDGRITNAAWKRRGTARARRELLDAGLAHQCDGYVEMHDYLDWQRSAAEIEEIKAGRGVGGSVGNHVRWHVRRQVNDPTCELCNPSKGIAPGSQERSDQDSDGDSRSDRSGSHSQLQRQRQNNKETHGGDVASVDATDRSTPPLYADRCAAHGDVPDPGPCGRCADVRKTGGRRPLALVPSTTFRCLIHAEDDLAHCRGCAADRKAADSA